MDEKLTRKGIIMEKILNDIMEQVLRFNTFLNEAILNNKEILEEQDNFQDFYETQTKLKLLLTNIKNTPLADNKAHSKNLIELVLLMGDLTWFFDNLHEQVKKIIRQYPYDE